MESPLDVIERIKNSMKDIIVDNDLKYLDGDITDIFLVYSADFCGILLGFFPGATIMMNNNYRSCGMLINGVIYDSSGIRSDVNNFHVVDDQEIGFIQKSFNQLSDDVIGGLMEKLKDNKIEKGMAFSLRKNRENLT